jgi:hypothetical protein
MALYVVYNRLAIEAPAAKDSKLSLNLRYANRNLEWLQYFYLTI